MSRQNELATELADQLKNDPDKGLFAEEAAFGISVITPYLKKIFSGNILEVGCGSGLCLNYLAQKYENCNFDGIEPYGNGFYKSEDLIIQTGNNNLKLHKTTFENFNENKKYDLIYSINVIEHFKDWKAYLVFLSKYLSNEGIAISLGPNYSFPYEPHFKIPIILNPKLTQVLFKERIKLLEQEYRAEGLWDTLNFITKKKLEFECEKMELVYRDNYKFMYDMIMRVFSDYEFSKRHKLLTILIKLLRITGIFNIVKIGFLKNYYPYMSIEIRKFSDD